jgi:hypothetical protein
MQVVEHGVSLSLNFCHLHVHNSKFMWLLRLGLEKFITTVSIGNLQKMQQNRLTN